jgi:hypothetical protein
MLNNQNENCENCIVEILKVILLLQQSACPNDSCLETCDKGFLGQSCNNYCNTRPIVLYCCGSCSTPISMPISKSSTETETSSVCRIEKLDGCCATCRVLANNTNEDSSYPFMATNSFFTVNLNCVSCLRCLDDTFVDCL